MERSTDGTNFKVLSSTLPADTTSYKDEGLNASTTYHYRVKATNAGGDSNYSGTAHATTPSPAGLYFIDDFERDTGTMFPPWSVGCWGPQGGVTTDPGRARKGSYSGKFTVYAGDCTSYPTRANVRWEQHFCEGDERYLGYSMYLPADFPNPNPGWMNLGQFGYGPPWDYPPVHFSYWGNGSTAAMMVYDQNTVSLGDIPVTLGAWNDLVLHEYFSSDPTRGYLEVWKDGKPVTFKNGSMRVYTNTLRTDATGCGSFDLQQYRQKGVWPSPLSVWFDEAKVGISYAAVNIAAPMAKDDSYSGHQWQPRSGSAPGVLSNDTAPQGHPLRALKVTDPSHGTLTLNTDGSFTYTPEVNFWGTDIFTYKANDGVSDGNTATVTITVQAVTPAPGGEGKHH